MPVQRCNVQCVWSRAKLFECTLHSKEASKRCVLVWIWPKIRYNMSLNLYLFPFLPLLPLQSLSPWQTHLLPPPQPLLPPPSSLLPPAAQTSVHHDAPSHRGPPTAPVSLDTPSQAETAAFAQVLIRVLYLPPREAALFLLLWPSVTWFFSRYRWMWAVP